MHCVWIALEKERESTKKTQKGESNMGRSCMESTHIYFCFEIAPTMHFALCSEGWLEDVHLISRDIYNSSSETTCSLLPGPYLPNSSSSGLKSVL